MDRYDWKILAERVSLQKGRPLEPFHLFVVQHVLDDLLPLVQSFIRLGCLPENITVVGIPYSSQEEAGQAIRDLGCSVYLPPIFPFDCYLVPALLRTLRHAHDAGERVIVLEDGGYVVGALSQLAVLPELNGLAGVVLGAVEQTTRGKRLDVELERTGFLGFPVVSIPDCSTKIEIEPPYIAEAVQRNLTLILTSVGATEIRSAGFFGFGTIGHRIARHLENQGVALYGNDPNPRRNYLMKALRIEDLTPKALSECDLVIGSTGATSITVPVLKTLKDGVIIASASSRQVEVDVGWLWTDAHEQIPIGPEGRCVMQIRAARRFVRVVEAKTQTITLLYDGYPVNFWERSLPDYVADAVLSLLLEGVIAVAGGRLDLARVYPGDRILETADIEVTQRFLATRPPDGIELFGI